MIKHLCLICLLGFIILFAVTTASAQEEDLQEKATSFINYYNNKDFIGAAKLFHFPKNYTEKEFNEDKNGISKTLKMYSEEFGKITNIKKSDNPSLFYFHTIGGGDLQYWQKYPDVNKISYKVMFSREGQGYFAIFFCHILDKWEIRNVQYGLSADRPDSQAKINNINQKWKKLLKQ